ncbi:piezo-type mechanosensitive ion channel homolog isoform X3 [Andrographis paniculata]|uniref:piezo-type mechanosensitive ion channel homolog isoform X3 n=1 Tax=Andrographis paniculata TaxID=175694 RepID=UPI0021E80E22|nr:piezo-type mechanosensitive ion channel homolog isoform X3 [Andrographis paniculata]
MASVLRGFVLPTLLLTGFLFRERVLSSWIVFIYSTFVVIVQVIFLIVCTTLDLRRRNADASWIKILGLMKVQSWRSPNAVYFLFVELLVAVVALIEIHRNKFGLIEFQGSFWGFQDSFWGHLSSISRKIGYRLRFASCLLLPVVQLALGISNPSWLSLPFFICSCIGLVDWSLTSNFLGLFRWWKLLWVYAGFSICLLYVYQLPVGLPHMIQTFFGSIGLYKVSVDSDWQKICSSTSLMVFYYMLSFVRRDLEDMEFIMSLGEDSLTERLIPPRSTIFVHQLRSGVRHTNILLKGPVFRHFSINWFTYGFPISLFTLSYWSFHFASICAFGLLAYVGYVFYAFPSLFQLHRLNGLLLVFILLWAVSTYIFNVVLGCMNWKLGKDMEIWEMVGLWHYPIPGFFLLAQFCLGILVALGNLVSNSVFLCISSEEMQVTSENESEKEKEDAKVIVVATIAWGLRKCSRAIMLLLISLIASKPGLFHASYMIFFFAYLLSHKVEKRMRQSLVLLCEVHFAILYILQFNLVTRKLERKDSLTFGVLQQLGLLKSDHSWDFQEIAFLLCFCAIHNHGSEMLFSFSSIVQHTPCPPIGFSILRAGLNKSVLLSVYATSNVNDNYMSGSHGTIILSKERMVSLYLNAIARKILSTYRSFGTYISFLTILIAVYPVKPNYVSLGYIFFLLFWLVGRQLIKRSRRCLWFPLKAYAIAVFVFIYILSTFPTFKMWMSTKVDLCILSGYDTEASVVENIWESLAVMIVMQIYSYERRQSEHLKSEDPNPLQLGILGFVKRFLIWHSQKILSITLFYASLSPISAFGFLYLLGLIFCSAFPKTSRIPSVLFLIYTSFLVMLEYLFQMWGRAAMMFPGQKYHDLSVILGLQLYGPTFVGLESGLRAKVLVIVACTLQYSVFRWLDQIPSSLLNLGGSQEPCPLFISEEHISRLVSSADGYNKTLSEPLEQSAQRMDQGYSRPSFRSRIYQLSKNLSSHINYHDGGNQKQSFDVIWGTTRGSHKLERKRTVALQQERFEMQKKTLKIYLKFWVENMFNLFGLEINMMALLVASFALLNAISMLYVACLAICIMLPRPTIRKMWPILVFVSAAILLSEYVAMWKSVMPADQKLPIETNTHCHECWRNSNIYFYYCKKCWLGLIVDDSRMLISYYVVFIFTCFKLRADYACSFSWSFTYDQMISQCKDDFVWRDLSFETKSMWSFLDYLRVYCYCHLLDLVLALILITGTMEYDILHLGYLGFALTFFRLRLTILKKKNGIFKYLRIYNFAVIVLSLGYQSPFIGDVNEGKCENTIDYIFAVIGFYKYDYGFRITSRSVLVEITIFVLVSCQSYVFSSSEFDYVYRYLEAEQIGAIVREKEKKAAWKTEQLQHLRKSEEKKCQHNQQVEKMKAEVLNLQIQLSHMNSSSACGIDSPANVCMRSGRHASLNMQEFGKLEKQDACINPDPGFGLNESLNLSKPYHSSTSEGGNGLSANEILRRKTDASDGMQYLCNLEKQGGSTSPDPGFGSCVSSSSIRVEHPVMADFTKHLMDASQGDVTKIEEYVDDDIGVNSSNKSKKVKTRSRGSPLSSAVQLLGDGVSQVQTIGNLAVNNLANFLNISSKDSDLSETSSPEDSDDRESPNAIHENLIRSSSVHSDKNRMSDSPRLQIGCIVHHIWSKMRSNNDVVCYCCFILVFLWNFSFLSMGYLAALFLYALCVNTGPNYVFWIIVLVYTELYVLSQYLYQIMIRHCGFSIQSDLLFELGFPVNRIRSSFVVGLLPLFLVYLFTLIQCSITAKDGEWLYGGFHDGEVGSIIPKGAHLGLSWIEKPKKAIQLVGKMIEMVAHSCGRYWKSLTQEAESPPYFVQLSMDVKEWPEHGIQPERICSGINQLLQLVHDENCKNEKPICCPCASRIQIQSIERSTENADVALVVFEVVYASSTTECKSSEQFLSLTPAADVAEEILRAKSMGLAEKVGFPYQIISVIGGGEREVDLYAYIFGADLIVFFLVAIFYQSVIKNNSEILEYYQFEDQFPKEFVFILMIIFFLIVVDRIIYLCSFATGKVIFYIFNLFLFTYAVNKYAEGRDPSQQNAAGFALRAIYLTKAVSLALQAIQIRHGVPHESTLYRQFLTSEVSHVNYIGHRLYRALPFLYELRCVLDWSCTTTSLTMYDWLKLEDIYASLYLVKCDYVLYRARHKQGEKQPKMTKFCNGICLFLILICVIWAPMLMYSSGNPTNIANPINDASFQLGIKTTGGSLILYQTTLCERIAWDQQNANVDLDPNHYLDFYDVRDIQLICCQADASNLWIVPDVIQRHFLRSLNRGPMDIKFSWVLMRDRPKGKEMVKYERSVDEEDLPLPSEVEGVLNGSFRSFRINSIYPRFFRVTGSGEVRPFEQEINDVSADLILHHGSREWWSFNDISSLDAYGCGGLSGPTAIIVSEETPQGFLGETLSKFSIWGLYITFVLAVGRFIRLQCSDLRMRIPYENLPSCDRLLAICENIYTARAEGELRVEEVLYWMLVKIYRSPHMLLEYTCPD